MLLTFIILISIFFLLYLTEKRRFLNVVALGLIGVYVIRLLMIHYPLLLPNDQGIISEMGIFIILASFPSIMFILSIAMFFNSKVLLEKEGRKVRNLMLAILGLSFVMMMIWYVFVIFIEIENVLWHILFFYAFLIFGYTMFLYTSVLAYAILYHYTPIRYEPNYIIALGSGLIGDRVPPLLASRLDEAVKQYKKYGERPFIIVSGGQGNDERISEAFAMKQYLINIHQIPPDKILKEDQSSNTEQNMSFSKKVMDHHAQGEKYRSIFVTNNFHVFRASIYAKKAKLDAEGIGSKTAFYYVPNAFTREFIGLLEMYKWAHITVFLIITLFVGLLLRAYV
ncbi:YdcF family protein [Lysinibacillus irui]|uniref:YdcF family protein n=1 Tax=Lysinibacillus irui TaxID=2998077 RepID=A0AAJ5RK10_9BACI|nr:MULTISPECIES: YdcF family protein [Lysinibacillus]MEA0555824.1 YdcF family protein [Lysinibacillus irui]WDV06441.1 YdcF family protein [Lysinibacillus irui]